MPPKFPPRYAVEPATTNKTAAANINKYDPAITFTPYILTWNMFKCRVCKVNKDGKHYSKKEMAAYQHKISRGSRLNGETANLRCRPCSGGSLNELFCEGPCEEYKALDQFSKTSRGHGGNKWCETCTHWKQSLEHDLVPAPPPNHPLGPDEDGGFYAGENDLPVYSDPEGGDDSDDYDDYDHASSAAWGASDHAIIPTQATASGLSDVLTSKFGKMNMSGQSAGPSSIISSTNSAWGLNSQHPSSTAPSGRLGSSASGANSSAPSGSPAPPATRPATNGMPHFGWDNTGVRHTQNRVPSGSEFSGDSGSIYSGSSSNVSVVSDATVRGPALPNSIATSGRSSNWAKPAGPATQPKKYVPVRPKEKVVPEKVMPDADDYDSDDYM